MIGSFLTRTLALVLGYAYPAYECFKVVELNRPEIEQLLFWCKYWILVAVLTVLERVGDTIISWLPMYSEAKVAFFVYLWYPKTRGATYVYETFLQPYVASHETDIDRNLLELRTRAGDFVVLYWQKVSSYGQTRVYEVLQYVASQAPSQQSRPRNTVRPAAPQSRQAPASESPAGHAAAATTTEVPPQAHQPNHKPATVPTEGTFATVPSASHTLSGNTANPTAAGAPPRPSVSGVVNQTDAAANSQPKETPIEEAVHMTRARLRRRAAATGSTSAR